MLFYFAVVPVHILQCSDNFSRIPGISCTYLAEPSLPVLCAKVHCSTFYFCHPLCGKPTEHYKEQSAVIPR